MRVAQRWQHRLRDGSGGLLALLLFAMQPLSTRADVQYAYDNAGRVVQVTAQDGSSAQYQYDEAGNIVAILRFAAGDLSLAAFNPISGVTGDQVTIHGSGFNTTPGANNVSFDGAAATVVSATANKLTVQVPSGATTGPISVSVLSNTVASNDDFVAVAAPAISGFSPLVIDIGGAVTVSGANLQPVPNSTESTIAGIPARITTISAAQVSAIVPTGAVSSAIKITTPYGQATSAASLIIAPPTIGAANIVDSDVVVVGGASQALSISASKYGVFSFDAIVGQYLSLQISSFTRVPAGTINYAVYASNNAVLASGSVSSVTKSIHLPRIAVTGTYLVAFTGGNATVQVNAALESNPIFNGSQPPLSVATAAPGQSKRFVIAATAGQNLGIGVSNLVLTPASGSASLAVYKPNGTDAGGQVCNPGTGAVCGLSLTDMAHSGDYLAFLTPNSPSTPTAMSFTFALTPAVTDAIAVGTPLSLSLPTPGQFAMLSFVATQNQTLNLKVSSIVTSPAQQMRVNVFDASGTPIKADGFSGAGAFNLIGLAAGTYKVQLSPYFGGTATAQVTLTAAVPLPTDSTSANFTTSAPGEPIYFAFAANAGDNVGIGISNLMLSTDSGAVGVAVTRPDGADQANMNCNASPSGVVCGLSLLRLPLTGQYLVALTPPAGKTMSFTLVFSQAVSNALTVGTPFNLSLPAYGQFAMLSFTATAGQTLTLNVSSIATNPSQPVWVSVFNSSGTPINSSGSGGGSTLSLNLPNLAADTYRIQISPYYGGTASAVVTLN